MPAPYFYAAEYTPTLACTRYCFTSKLECGSPSSVYYPSPTCKAYAIAVLLDAHCAIYAPPPTPDFYTIHHTLLVMEISCKGQHPQSLLSARRPQALQVHHRGHLGSWHYDQREAARAAWGTHVWGAHVHTHRRRQAGDRRVREGLQDRHEQQGAHPTCWINIHVFLWCNRKEMSTVRIPPGQPCIWRGYVHIQGKCIHRTG